MLSHRQRLAGTAIFSLTLAFLATDKAALADCSAVGDVVTCDSAGGDNSPYDAGAGNNTINIVSGAFADSINGNAGNDTFNGTGGTVGALAGNDGLDIFSLGTGFSVTGDVTGDAGDDTFTLDGAVVDGDLRGGTGEDDFEILSGSVDTIGGGVGDDFIAIEGGTVLGNVEGNENEDVILITGGAIGGDVLGGSNSDVILVGGGSIGGNIDGGTNSDLIGIGGTATVTGDILTGSGNFNAVLIGNPLDGTGDATVTGDIIGGSGVDIVGLIAADTVSGTIDTGASTDIIYVLGGESIIDPSITGDFNDQLEGLGGLIGGDGNDYLVFDNVGDNAAEGFATLPATISGVENIAVINGSVIDMMNPASDLRDFSEVQQFVVWDSAIGVFGNSPATMVVGGNFVNAGGEIFMADGEANDTIVIGGDYAGFATGTGSAALVMDAALDGSEASDRLVIDGNVGPVTLEIPELSLSTVVGDTVTGNTTEIYVNNVGNGIGSWTGKGAGDGILLVDVGGTSSATDFVLANGPIQVGVFDYTLAQEGNDWYLQSDLLDQGFAYGAIPAAMLAVQSLTMDGLYSRVGDIRQVIGGAQLNEPDQSLSGLGGYSGAWVRGLGSWGTHDGDLNVGGSSVPTSFDQDIWGVQAGADFDVTSTFGMSPEDGALVLGLSGIYGKSYVHADDDVGSKAADYTTDFYGAQFTGTWYMPNGIYADLAGQVLWYNGDVETVSGGKKADVDGFGYGVGGEVGYQIPVTRYVQIVPNGRLNYQHANFDDFTDNDGVDVSMNDAKSLEGRLGVVVDAAMRPGRGAWFTGFVEANVVHEFLDNASVDAAGTELGYDLKGTAAEVGLGLSARVVNSVSIYAQVDYQIPFDSNEGTNALGANGGIRVAF